MRKMIMDYHRKNISDGENSSFSPTRQNFNHSMHVTIPTTSNYASSTKAKTARSISPFSLSQPPATYSG